MQKMQAGTAGSPRTDAALAEQVNALIKQRLGEPLTLKTLASVLAVSPFHLQRLYKRFTGRSPAAQLQKARIEAAKKRCWRKNPLPSRISERLWAFAALRILPCGSGGRQGFPPRNIASFRKKTRLGFAGNNEGTEQGGRQ